jgi:hypothetical protein
MDCPKCGSREWTKNMKIFYSIIFSYVSSFRVFRVKKENDGYAKLTMPEKEHP